MNSAQREFFRLALLRVLSANKSGRALGAPALSVLVGEFGFSPRAEEVTAALEYLEAIGAIHRQQQTISPENAGWKITDAGSIILERQG